VWGEHISAFDAAVDISEARLGVGSVFGCRYRAEQRTVDDGS
jgi:hypothetical protein